MAFQVLARVHNEREYRMLLCRYVESHRNSNNYCISSVYLFSTIMYLEMVVKQLAFQVCDSPQTFNIEHWHVQYSLLSFVVYSMF